MTQQRCPNILIQKGTKYYLYNSKVAKVPGVNPIEFQNLEDYVEFIDWQRSQGIRCPVLYLQHSYDTQGEPVYKIRPSPTDLQGGLPPNVAVTQCANPENPASLIIDDTNISTGGTGEVNYQIPLVQQNENLLHNNPNPSPNAMDDNWGGPRYTNDLVKAGYYKGSEVSLYIP